MTTSSVGSVEQRPAPKLVDLEMEARVREIPNRWPAVGLAVGVVRDGRLQFFHGYGVADIASKQPISEDTVFRIASITKTFTAIAVMQLWEQGLVDLDAPANDYLRAFKLIPAKAGFRPATVRHLLTHTAGIPQMVQPLRAVQSGWFGESVALGQPVPSLAEFYRGRLKVVVEPGSTFTYTDHGIATAGQIVEDLTGQSLARYFRERIFEPLGMVDTDLLRSERVESRLATGYRLRSNGAKAVTDRQWVAAAAASIYSTPRDMARYLAALLGGGANEKGSILKPETLATMFEPHYQPDPRVPGMGMGFWRTDLGGHLALEHQGVIPGFNSQIYFSPNDGLGVMAFTNGSRNAMTWLTAESARLLGHLIGVGEGAVRTDVPQHPEIWGDICGWYRPRAQATDMQTWSMAGAGAEVVVRRGRLTLRALSPIPAIFRGFELHPDDDEDPYIFRIDLSRYGIGTERVVFSHGPGAEMGLHLEMPPMSLRKLPAGRNRRALAISLLGAASAAIAIRRHRRTGRGDGEER